MSARADVTVWLDTVPSVRARALEASADEERRAFVSIADSLTLFGSADVVRATLTAALAAVDALEAVGATR